MLAVDLKNLSKQDSSTEGKSSHGKYKAMFSKETLNQYVSSKNMVC